MKNYKVLKDWDRGEIDGKPVIHVAGQIVNEIPEDEAAALVADGTLELLGDEVKLSGETVPFTVDQAFLDANPGSDLELGQEIQIPKEVADMQPANVSEGSVVVPATPSAQVEPKTAEAIADADKELHYMGKLVTSNGFRTVGDIEVRHLRLEDGSEHDITEEEYQDIVKAA